MRSLLRMVAVGLFCLGAAGAAAALLVMGTGDARRVSRGGGTARRGSSPGPVDEAPVFDLNVGRFDDGGFATASLFQAPIKDPSSLAELRESVGGRGRRGIKAVSEQLAALRPEQQKERTTLEQSLGMLYMYEGRFEEAARTLEKVLEDAGPSGQPEAARLNMTALLGIIALRRGELDNCIGCVGPSSCVFPIAAAARHKKPEGSREAVRRFMAYLQEKPHDLRVIWLLNIAAMTLGEHPGGLPSKFLLPTQAFASSGDIGHFENVAIEAGLTARGPNLAGGSVFDDFTGDGRPDLFTTSLDAERGASFFVNRGDGTFEDRSTSAGLDDQVYALNVRACDYDNDGRLDVLMLRGGWERPLRMSLLRNRGGGTFEDVTRASGLGEPIASEVAAWGDFDNDGWPDVFVGGEYLPPNPKPPAAPGDPRNRCRLYRNMGDGTFKDVAASAGVLNERCTKGAAWGDYDGDGRLDLFVSNMAQLPRLYHNEGGNRFRDVAPELGLFGAAHSFACWWWDYDNDGHLDLYLNDYSASVSEALLSAMGQSVPQGSHPRLYHNLGDGNFEEVSKQVGLDRAMAPMGVNFGDLDNDGFLDLYFGTGDMSYGGLDRNLMFHNLEGRGFADVTTSSGTGHLQKGHGVSFADHDGDGDLDLFVELGGATPGDQAYNVLFRNPGHADRHWLGVKLVGTKTNRSALGAQIRADLKGPDGRPRSIYRTVGNNSSFGGNSLTEHLGLAESTRVESLTISWPRGAAQVFHDVPADREIEITEGVERWKPLTP